MSKGTTTEKTLNAAIEQKQLETTLVTVKDHEDGARLLGTGDIDAYASDRGLLIGLLLASGKKDSWHVGDEMYSYEPYALMLRQNDSAFRRVVNQELARIYRSREIYDIYNRWFGAIGKAGPLLDSMIFLNSLPE